jgi:hypothetical protein
MLMQIHPPTDEIDTAVQANIVAAGYGQKY